MYPKVFFHKSQSLSILKKQNKTKNKFISTKYNNSVDITTIYKQNIMEKLTRRNMLTLVQQRGQETLIGFMGPKSVSKYNQFLN